MTTVDRETARRVLDLPMQPNDADADTVRDYLIALLAQLWEASDGFSGKRPFGNSGWEWDMFVPLIKAELIDGILHEDGYAEDVDDRASRKVIAAAIDELGRVA